MNTLFLPFTSLKWLHFRIFQHCEGCDSVVFCFFWGGLTYSYEGMQHCPSSDPGLIVTNISWAEKSIREGGRKPYARNQLQEWRKERKIGRGAWRLGRKRYILRREGEYFKGVITTKKAHKQTIKTRQTDAAKRQTELLVVGVMTGEATPPHLPRWLLVSEQPQRGDRKIERDL